MRRIYSALQAVIAVLALWVPAAALAQKPAAVGQTPITVTDIAGREVTVNAPVKRILLGEGRQLYLIASLEPEDPLARIVAWRNDLIEADPATYAQYLEAFPKLAKLPAFPGQENGLLDIESTIVQKPDVVLLNLEAMRANEDVKYIEKLAELKIPVVYIDFRHFPLKNTEPTIRLLGKIMGREARAEEIIEFRHQAMARVSDVIARVKPESPKVFIERIGGYADDCCLSFGAENFGKYVELAGGHNIGSDILPTTFGQLNPEQVIVANPEHVVVTSADWQAYVPGGHWIPLGPGADPQETHRKLEWFTTRHAYTGIAAQKTRNFHGIWHQFYNSPYEFFAVQQLAKWFHPELFADLDPDATFAEYHRRFLPIPYKPGYAISLVGSAD
ncbi:MULTISPECIES: ABC transporter substrate-binding protein [Sinorhizobium]|uniref:ABC transporter substrate-binding protein n=1 Tax=Sinorhizobium TaxID=28105 RepID=UPI000BE7CC50|nr:MULTISPECIES: ABC transporter substrate-binding protein [Sinorhizobium]PDT51170.1 ABC transporter substrate-binding protein [Sinorhizobium sp. NG07B]POH25824.1 ABC transporter substrate-binding protein [Sinorhizobium americanum]